MKLTYRLLGIVEIVLMSPFSWQCQNLCGLSLAFIIDGRVVTGFVTGRVALKKPDPFRIKVVL